MLERSESWFRPVANGLWDTGKRGTSVKVKALAALGATAKALVMSDEEGGEGWATRKHELAEIFSAAFHVSRGLRPSLRALLTFALFTGHPHRLSSRPQRQT